MPSPDKSVSFVWFGDLHLTEAGLPNHVAAQRLVDEVNTLIRPDFAVFAGDNVQHAQPKEFELFNALRALLRMPHQVLVGDHDVHHDPTGHQFRQFIGDPFGSFSLGGFRFVRLNTLEYRPVGISDDQIAWFQMQSDMAAKAGERVVLLQHHYPYKVWEQFDGPGIEAWREIVRAHRPAAIFCGHTHYGQIANDGREISIATRSIGDPEGGPPGYLLAHLCGDDLALIYRTVDETGPAILITHPRNVLLATGPKHIVRGMDRIEARCWSKTPIVRADASIDQGNQISMHQNEDGLWSCELDGRTLAKGEHCLEVRCRDAAGLEVAQTITFMVDLTGRYTAVPIVHPVVKGTAFC
jgi:3',5'-cyclic AMP phosphodiesterase CpdA